MELVLTELCVSVLKCGIYCSLFEVVDGKGKATSSTLSGLIHKLERERMVSHSLTVPLQDVLMNSV